LVSRWIGKVLGFTMTLAMLTCLLFGLGGLRPRILRQEEPMDTLSRRSMLRRSYGLAGAAASSLRAGNSQARAKRPEPDRKLKVVAVGGHFDDPQTCAGGTLTLFADQGHDVIALSITGGRPSHP
jgi:hypothetical protein